MVDEVEENEQALYEHFAVTVDKGQALLRIDKFLMGKVEGISRNRVQNAAHAGAILVNGAPVRPNYRVKPLDVISVVMAKPPRDTTIVGENIPLNMVFEDDWLAVVNKPAGMVVHPGYNNYTGTLVHALTFHFGAMPSTTPDVPRPGLVHRIDKNTSGLLVIAKEEVAMTHLAKQFFDHSIERTYYALAWGDFEEERGTINVPIGRSVQDRRIMQAYPDGGDVAKHAVTHWQVLERFGLVTLLKLNLETGRTHQIRTHLRFIGHPIFNDADYGGARLVAGAVHSKLAAFVRNAFEAMPRLALHAKSLGFVHPHTRKQMQFDTELPPDFDGLLERWRRYSNANARHMES